MAGPLRPNQEDKEVETDKEVENDKEVEEMKKERRRTKWRRRKGKRRGRRSTRRRRTRRWRRRSSIRVLHEYHEFLNELLDNIFVHITENPIKSNWHWRYKNYKTKFFFQSINFLWSQRMSKNCYFKGEMYLEWFKISKFLYDTFKGSFLKTFKNKCLQYIAPNFFSKNKNIRSIVD